MKASERVVTAILEAIASGEFPIGEELPAESALAERYSVSRLTIREATGVLASASVLEVQQGRRNRVADMARWSVLDPAIVETRARLQGSTSELVAELMEARRVLEVGIARLAARRVDDEQLTALAEQVELMRACIEDDSMVERSASADIRFHEVIQEAARNAYLVGAFAPLSQMLLRVRLETSSTRSVRADAVAWHEKILAALQAHDEDAAGAAMAGHMAQTSEATRTISLV